MYNFLLSMSRVLPLYSLPFLPLSCFLCCSTRPIDPLPKNNMTNQNASNSTTRRSYPFCSFAVCYLVAWARRWSVEWSRKTLFFPTCVDLARFEDMESSLLLLFPCASGIIPEIEAGHDKRLIKDGALGTTQIHPYIQNSHLHTRCNIVVSSSFLTF